MAVKFAFTLPDDEASVLIDALRVYASDMAGKFPKDEYNKECIEWIENYARLVNKITDKIIKSSTRDEG